MWRGTREDVDCVKQRLQEERQRWLEKQHAAGYTTPPQLKFLSIGKLLRVIAASRAAPDPCEALTQWGIVRHEVGEHDQRQPKERTVTTSAVAYTSSHAWLTGFLHFRDEAEASVALRLCDASSAVPSVLLDPSPFCVDQLVLLKHWVLVDKTLSSEHALTAAFLEVHEDPVLLQSDSRIKGGSYTKEEVLKVLKTSYLVQDPPLYTGKQAWAEAALAVRANQATEISPGTVAMAEPEQMNQKAKQKKRKSVHAVFGRVTSVSPISWQQERASCHFFLEVERHDGSECPMQQSVVNVMFTGAANLRWHLFLRPGKLVLLSDLTKVFSQECGLFLLQTTTDGRAKSGTGPNQASQKTSVMIWGPDVSPSQSIRMPVQSEISASYSKQMALRCCGRLVDYEGRVVKLLWDECVELRGSNSVSVLVCLFRFPNANDLAWLRKDSILQIRLAHVLRWSTPVGGKIVLGLCPRSHLAIKEYGEASSPCISAESRPIQRPSSRRWSQLGDFHRQSMTLSMWLLETLELLSKKFYFGSDSLVQGKSSFLAFPQARRREAVVRVAKRLGVNLPDGKRGDTGTLGALFLNCHTTNATNCTTIQFRPSERLLAFTRVLTVQELQALGERVLDQRVDEGQLIGSNEDAGPCSVKILGNDLDWCLLVGSFRGNIESGDLEICDRTGSIPLHLKNGDAKDSLIDLHGGRGVYWLRDFELAVEDFNEQRGFDIEERLPLVYGVSCSWSSVEYISMGGDGDTRDSAEEPVLGNEQSEQELTIMVTHVDALPQSKMRSTGFLPEYRLLHGVVLPIGAQLSMENFVKATHCADFLMRSDCANWHMRRFGCYRVTAVQLESKEAAAPSRSALSIEEKAVAAWGSFCGSWQSNALDKGVCLYKMAQLLMDYETAEAEEAVANPVRVYQLETGRRSINPIGLNSSVSREPRCKQHELCQRTDRYESGIDMFPLQSKEETGNLHTTFNFGAQDMPVRRMEVDVPAQEFVTVSVLRHFVQKFEAIVSVGSLLRHQLRKQPRPPIKSSNMSESSSVEAAVDPELHKSRLVSLVGVITSKTFYWRRLVQQQQLSTTTSQETMAGTKRIRELHSDGSSCNFSDASRRLVCKFHVRDLELVDTVDIQVDVSRFSLLGSLQVGSVVEFTRLQGFVARSSYKVYLNWSNVTAARPVRNGSKKPPLSDAELYGSMTTTFLNDLYRSRDADRTLQRYVVRMVHVNYVLLKRKCRMCHRALQLDKWRGCWKHASVSAAKSTRECVWRQQLRPVDAAFAKRSYLSTSMRCIIDDGSAQAELFLENDVAWELLPCTHGQRRRFEDILSLHAEELSYFSGHASAGFFSNSKAARELEYYENELRALVVAAVPALRSLVVFARRFYSAASRKGGRGAAASTKQNTSVLTFSKDIQLTTTTQPPVKLEAQRVDPLHVRSELQSRLVRLRARPPT